MDPTNCCVTSWTMKQDNSEKTASHKPKLSEDQKWMLLFHDLDLGLEKMTLRYYWDCLKRIYNDFKM